MLDQIMLNALNERSKQYGVSIGYDLAKGWHVIRNTAFVNIAMQFSDFAGAFKYYMDTLVDFECRQKDRR